jgi:hypothetical protein
LIEGFNEVIVLHDCYFRLVGCFGVGVRGDCVRVFWFDYWNGYIVYLFKLINIFFYLIIIDIFIYQWWDSYGDFSKVINFKGIYCWDIIFIITRFVVILLIDFIMIIANLVGR